MSFLHFVRQRTRVYILPSVVICVPVGVLLGATASPIAAGQGSLRRTPQVSMQSDSSDAWMAQLTAECDAKQFGRAQALMAHVDSLGLAARQARIRMHMEMIRAYRREIYDGDKETPRANFIRLEKELERTLHIFAEERPQIIDLAGLQIKFANYWTLLNIVLPYIHPDSIPIVVAHAKADLAQYDRLLTGPGELPWGQRTLAQTVSDVPDGLLSHWYNYRLQGGGVRAPRLQADYWFPAPERPPSDTVRPVPGKVNLICSAGIPKEDTSGVSGSDYSAIALADNIRYWLQRYGAKNLEVTIVWPVADTPLPPPPGYNGWYAGRWQQAKWQQSELGHKKLAELWRWYVQDHEKLPVTVAVQVPHLTWRQTPDGHRVQVKQLQFNDFWNYDPGYTRVGIFTDKRTIPPLYYVSATDSMDVLGPADAPSDCAIIGRDGTMEHTSVQPDYMQNTKAAMQLLFEGGGAPPRPGHKSWIDPY